ncbi:GntR family transcriptional regulator [Dactylosporangium sp. CA-092794]|uniref:GntR family transcriptional regulator n=1 Tax=Dactylosporangium sp. CA-092794 TaxID=3239929 RepID=UPI003D8C1AE2
MTVAYRSLAQELRSAILANRFADGVRLPTEEQLSRERGLSRQTVRRAYQDLVGEGLVYRVPGRGTFASAHDSRYLRQSGSIEELMGFAIDTEFELLLPLHDVVDAAAASRLGLGADHVTTATFRRIHNGRTFCSTRVFLPVDVGRLMSGLPELTEQGVIRRATIVGLLDRVAEQPITEAEQVITVAPLPGEIAGHFAVPARTPMLRIDRTYYDATGRAVELAVNHYLPEHYSYRVRLYRTPVAGPSR